MSANKLFEDLSQKLSETLASSPLKDVEKNARALASSALARLDLVSREEFDVQSMVLARTREQLSVLEARIAALEAVPAAQAKQPATDDTTSV
jgi:BMFP domain-containing protein YqiC